jgi:hypothetical protein
MASIHDENRIITFESSPTDFQKNFEKETLYDSRYDNTWYISQPVTTSLNPTTGKYNYTIVIAKESALP